MKIIQFILITVLLVSTFTRCQEPKKTSLNEKYPQFSHIDTLENGSISLNNFSKKSDKNGLEYLVDSLGQLIEKRNWSNDLLNGVVERYARNGKVYLTAEYVNDTILGAYCEYDTITGKLLKQIESIRTTSGIIDNNIMVYKKGIIDEEQSFYYTFKKISNSKYQIILNGNILYKGLKLKAIESNSNDYLFLDKEIKEEFFSSDGVNCFYEVKDLNCKYLKGCLYNYRKLTIEEAKAYNSDTSQTIARVLYFNIAR